MNSCRNKVFAKLQKPLLGGPIAAHSFVLVKSCEARGTNLCKKKTDWKRKGNRKINGRKEEEEINVENIIENVVYLLNNTISYKN